MSAGERPRDQFLHTLPADVLSDFCWVMDALPDRDWTRFASKVLEDQTDVRLAEKERRKTDWVMNRLENRNMRVGYLVDVLEHLQLLRPRDIILHVSSSNPPSSRLPSSSLPTPPTSQFDPLPKEGEALANLSTLQLSTIGDEGGRVLPRPAPPPSCLQSGVCRPPQPLSSVTCYHGTVMCWPYEELHAETDGFSPARQIGEGGFGVVYRASLRNTDCAIKKLKEDSLDLTLLRESFKTEVEKLSKFRHTNIIDLLGFSEGGGSMCLIYSYMENRSLEDQLHNESVILTWPQRIRIVEGASAALQFLHSSSKDQNPLIHGDVKSSNILLDRHMEAKLSDFGLARFSPVTSSASSTSRTAFVGKTTSVRGTVAYLPWEYVRNGELGTKVDVFSFGVVLLEVLTGRRALEKGPKSSEKYLKDLVEDLESGPGSSSAEAWRNQLDERMMAGGVAEPAGFLQVATLACETLRENRKQRPTMAKVFEKLKDVHKLVTKASSSSSSSSSAGTDRHNSLLRPPSDPSFPSLPRSLDSNVGALTHKLSKLGPLEDTCPSQFSSLTSADPLHSSSSLQLTSSVTLPPLSSSSFAGPCETDESRGFSQYSVCSLSNGTSCRSLSPSARDKQEEPAGPTEFESSQPSVPVQDQYDFPEEPNCTSNGNHIGSDTRGQASAHLSGLSPGGSLQSASMRQSQGSPGYSVLMNPSKQRLLEKKSQYEEGRIQTPELLSDDLYGLRNCEDFRGPEESDEFDFFSH